MLVVHSLKSIVHSSWSKVHSSRFFNLDQCPMTAGARLPGDPSNALPPPCPMPNDQ
ncbi:MAG: hypothetical protein KME31_01530 [Tolypothrix carrinoi HA7290-LM1]|nr:hypothetical protein [Tolypothrix carrinoi HA7290-LM1]